MRLSHTVQYYALVAFARLLCLVPRRAALALGSALGRLGWSLGIRRKLVLANIALARPDASPAELRRIGARAASNFGRTASEFIRYGIKDRDAIDELVHIDGLELLRNALAAGKGAIVLTGHHGAWAIYFAAVAMKGIPLSLLVGKQHNPKVDAFILKIPGDRVEFISKGRSAVKKILANLTAGRAVVMVADQHAGKAGAQVPFFGKPTSTLALPGSFAVKYDAPVFLMTGHRRDDGNHDVAIKALDVPLRDTPEAQKIEVLRRYNEELGAIVAARPEQYFWYHRRWRDRDGAPPQSATNDTERS